jgi:hypothetical protein
VIRTVEELWSLFPEVIHKGGAEYATACPFCGQKGELGGEDRFIWWIDKAHCWCRVEQRIYHYTDIAAAFNETLDPDFQEKSALDAAASRQEKEFDLAGQRIVPSPEAMFKGLWTQGQVDAAHAAVDRGYWRKFGWDDATIDRFQLGYGEFHGELGHIIPMHVSNSVGDVSQNYYIASRLAVPRGKQKVIRNSKYVKGQNGKDYFWYLPGDDTSTILLAEGEKDGITASFLGFSVAVAYGTAAWGIPLTQYLKKLGYTTILVAQDYDDAGNKLVAEVQKNAQRLGGLTVRKLDWDAYTGEKSDGLDITNLLERHAAHTRELLLEMFAGESAGEREEIEDTSAASKRFIQNFIEVDSTYQVDAAIAAVTPIDDIRAEIKTELQEYIDHYRSKYRDSVFLLCAPPGSGKSYAAVEEAERVAMESMQQRQQLYADIQRDLREISAELAAADSEDEEYPRLQRAFNYLTTKRDRFTFTSVVWFGAFKNGFAELAGDTGLSARPDLWYDFEARSETNCANFKMASKLGEAGHSISKYCSTHCPFAATCRASDDGYMHQYDEARQYPIVYMRHPHLWMLENLTGVKLVVVDENAMGEMVKETRITRRKLTSHTHGWDATPGHEKDSARVRLLVHCLVEVLAARSDMTPVHPEFERSSRWLLRQLDIKVREYANQSLEMLINELLDADALKAYQRPPMAGDDEATVTSYVLEPLYRAIREEMPGYLSGLPENEHRPSILYVVGDAIHLYNDQTIKAPEKAPIIYIDGSLPVVLEALPRVMFGRKKSKTYRPTIYNPNSLTVQVRGDDYTKTGLKLSAVGQAIEAAKAAQREDIPESVKALQPERQKHVGDKVEEALEIIRYVASLHQQVLVVTHNFWDKRLEEERQLFYPEISNVTITHYNALRGRNEYKGYDAAVLLGVPRLRVNDLVRYAQVWMWHIAQIDGEDALINPVVSDEREYVPRPYPGTPNGIHIPKYKHWMVSGLSDLYEDGEMVQCGERIRQHSTADDKTIYVFGNVPCTVHVDVVLPNEDFLTEARDPAIRTLKQEMMEYAAQYRTVYRPNILHKQHGLPRGYASRLSERLKAQIGRKRWF